MNRYNSGSPLVQTSIWRKKVFGEESSYEIYFFLSVNDERAKQSYAKHMDRRIFLSMRQYFYETISQKILNKGLKQQPGTFMK